jgi:PhnB protein
MACVGDGSWELLLTGRTISNDRSVGSRSTFAISVSWIFCQSKDLLMNEHLKDLGPSVAPMLSVRNGAKAIAFYEAAFGARVLFKVEDPDGAVVAQLALGQSDFWLADESPEHKNFSPETLGGSTVRMVLVVDDPDSVFEQALAAGANVVWPVADQPYGWRVGRVVDPFGHHWEIGKPLR